MMNAPGDTRDWLRQLLTAELSAAARVVATQRLAEATTAAEQTMFRRLVAVLAVATPAEPRA
jgi:hypothetical protein